MLGIVGGRRRSLPAALAGIGCVLAGATTAWMGLGPDEARPGGLGVTGTHLTGAALWLLAELAAWTWRTDPFWKRPTAIVAAVGEVTAAVATVGYAGVVVLAAPYPVDPDPPAALAAALVSLTWLTALTRRSTATAPRARPQPAGATHDQRAMRPAGGPTSAMPPTGGTPRLDRRSATPQAVASVGPLAAAVAACASVALATGSGLATAWALTVFGGSVVLVAPRLPREADASAVLAVGMLTWAPVAAYLAEADIGDEVRLSLVAGLGLAGALIVAAAVVTTRSSVPAREATTPALVMAPLSLLPLAAGCMALGAAGEGPAAAGVAVVGVWLVAAVLDLADLDQLIAWNRVSVAMDYLLARGWPGAPESSGPKAAPGADDSPVGVTDLVRALGFVPLVLTLGLEPGRAAVVAGLAAVLALVDAVRRDQPWLLLGTGAAVPIVAGGVALDQGTTVADAGLVVTLTGVAWLGLAGSLRRRWARPALIAAGLAGAAGGVLCLEDRAATASYLLVAGTALAAAGVAVVHRPLVAAGAVVATLGFWSHLSLAEVEASEPYIAPAALLAVAAGMSARQRAAGATGSLDGFGTGTSANVSSWVAYTPSVALLGGAALVERLAGGPAWHAIVAGAVGVVAVAAGGVARLAGPLLVGTMLVVATTVHETLSVTTRLHTWMWLASGGVLLLAAGIAMERRDTGPVETGKRLVDLIRDQFT